MLGLFAMLVIGLISCDRLTSEPIRIGFVGGLTGRSAAVGIAARDGALLAVEEVNRAGGIDGRKVELIIRDTQQDPVVALDAVNTLTEAKVPAIIGPMLSSAAIVLVPKVNRTETLLVSPTVSTMMLEGKDDNFLRIRPQCRIIAHRLADYIATEKAISQVAIIADVGNSAYTRDWQECFTSRFQSTGGQVVSVVNFDSGGDHRFSALVDEALKEKPTGVLLLANSLDTAMLSQQIFKEKTDVSLFSSEWSMTRDLLRSGGHSLEGMTLFHVFNESSKKQKYLEFKKNFRARFRQEVSFPSVYAYDATQVVLTGLKAGARTGPELKKTLLKQDSFDTLQTTIGFDQYGDVKRELYLTVVKDGKFVVAQ